MNILKKAFVGFISFLFIFSSVNALVLEGDINLDEATENSLKISWDAVDGSIGYFVYYDITSHEEDKGYLYSSDDMIEGTGFTIENLDQNTDYFIALRVVDGEGNEGDFSKEYVFKTLGNVTEDEGSTTEEDKGEDTTSGDIENKLIIEKVDVVNSNKIFVYFNTEIDSEQDSKFKLEQKDNNLLNYNIENVSIDGKKIELTISPNLESEKIYTLIAVSLTGINGETIDAGVDGIIDFETGDLMELNSAAPEESLSNEEKTENSVVGTNVSDNDIKKTAELAAKKSEKLPQTGPAEWLLFITALILAFGIIKFRKQA